MKIAASLRSRRLFKWVHTWIGLVAGLVIAVVSLTGSVSVFRTEIQLASSPRGAGGPRVVGLDEIASQIAHADPNAQIRRVRFPAAPGDPFVVQVELAGKQKHLVCEASTGRVLGTLQTGWTDWMVDLHRNLLAGKTGRKAVGAIGMVLFMLAATGLSLWLMGARKWQAWITVRPQGGTRRFHFELHRAVGLWSYGLLTVVAFAGIGLAYPDTFRDALQHVTGGPAANKSPRVAESASQTLRTLDEYFRIGAGAMPDGAPTELRLPERNKAPVDLRLRRPGDLSPSGNHVYIEPSTGRVLAVSKAADQPLATRIFSAFAPIHYGEFGGLPIKMLWGLLGLIPSVLFVTGLITWWRPNQRKTRLAARQDVVSARNQGAPYGPQFTPTAGGTLLGCGIDTDVGGPTHCLLTEDEMRKDTRRPLPGRTDGRPACK
jgi:uncharacterized iron-regulated membrane protein